MRRVPELDGLRALAALVVLLFHLDQVRFFFGWTGVDLFFVLSGYLITAIILDHGDAPHFLRNFYVRRGLRIWPIYYLTLLTLVVINPRLPRPQPLDSLPNYLTYTQNVSLYWSGFRPAIHPAFDHSWTLALEEQFYLIWPALVLLVGRRRLPAACLAVAGLAAVAREGFKLYFVLPIRFGPFAERLLLGRCDGFALGGLLAALMDRARGDPDRLAWVRRGCALVVGLASAYLAGGSWAYGIVTFFGLPSPTWRGTHLIIAALYFGLVGLVATNLGRPSLAVLRLPALVYLGQISYGLYLYHYPLYWALDGFAFRPGGVRDVRHAALKVGLTLLVAAASWHLIERPILGLKDRFRYRSAPPGG